MIKTIFIKPNKVILALFFGIILAQPLFSQTTVKTVGATGADYSNLRTAFTAINSGAITGDIELQIISSVTDNNTAKLYGAGQVGEIIIPSGQGGSGYVVGEILTFSQPQLPNGEPATARVSQAILSAITRLEVINPGSGYTSAPTILTTSGVGTGANPTVLIGITLLCITSISANAALMSPPSLQIINSSSFLRFFVTKFSSKIHSTMGCMFSAETSPMNTYIPAVSRS